MKIKTQYCKLKKKCNIIGGNSQTPFKLTEVAGEGGPDLAPQKFLLSQKFGPLMG